MSEPMGRLSTPRLMAISEPQPSLPGLRAWVTMLADAGVDTVQIREKDTDDRALFARVEAARDAAGPRLRIVVNGRLDIALAGGAQGVHLPENGLPASVLRQRFGNHLLIGCSTHALEEIVAAREGGADYVTFGPIADTPSKRAFGAPQGLDSLGRAAHLGLPVLALGGISPDDFEAVAAAGASGAAGIRAFRTGRGTRRAVAAAKDAWPPSTGIDTLARPGAFDSRRRRFP